MEQIKHVKIIGSLCTMGKSEAKARIESQGWQCVGKNFKHPDILIIGEGIEPNLIANLRKYTESKKTKIMPEEWLTKKGE